MVFDPCPHQVTQIVLKAGGVIRQLKGLPEETNITILYNETAPLLGIVPTLMSSSDADHLPSPNEMRTPEGAFTIPRRDCINCGKKETMILGPICGSCADSEGGKYQSMWFCGQMDRQRNLIPDTGCGFKEKFEEFFTQKLIELGVEVPNGMKETLGIKTFTNEGLK